ncbi:hypothetical protein ACE6ED_19740 [Paenibacillus sp. CN-4]|uniref:hypothetical protein n=1 Tax=Paenibacillus nanchangensis TaxID=3348343 RepID=UPI00397AFCE0
MISYVLLGVLFLFVAVQVSLYAYTQRKSPAPEEIDEKLLASLNGGERRLG